MENGILMIDLLHAKSWTFMGSRNIKNLVFYIFRLVRMYNQPTIKNKIPELLIF